MVDTQYVNRKRTYVYTYVYTLMKLFKDIHTNFVIVCNNTYIGRYSCTYMCTSAVMKVTLGPGTGVTTYVMGLTVYAIYQQ